MALPVTLSETLVVVAQADIFHLDVRRDAAGEPVVIASYNVRRQSDSVVRQSGQLAITLSGAQKTSLASFITSVVVPQINAGHAG